VAALYGHVLMLTCYNRILTQRTHTGTFHSKKITLTRTHTYKMNNPKNVKHLGLLYSKSSGLKPGWHSRGI